MSISRWPEGERPREKLQERGPGALSNAELLAILLRTGTLGQTALDLARSLLTRFGSLRGLAMATANELANIPGIGPAKHASLAALAELARRYQAESIERGKAFEDPKAVRDFLAGKLRDRNREIFGCLFLDNRHRVIAFDELFQGGLASTNVHAGEVVRRALLYQAALTGGGGYTPGTTRRSACTGSTSAASTRSRRDSSTASTRCRSC